MGVAQKEKPVKKLLNPSAGLRSELRLRGVGMGGGRVTLRVTPRSLA